MKIGAALRYAFFILSLGLISCSGGGGGGSADGAIGKNDPGIRVLHSVIDAAPFDFSLESEQEFPYTVPFGISQNYRKAPEDLPSVVLYRAKTLERITTIPVSIEDRDRKTVLVYGLQETGVVTRVIEDDPPELDGDVAAVRLYHGVRRVSAAQLDINGIESSAAGYGGASDYLIVPAGPVSYRVFDASDGRTIFRGDAELLPETVYSVLAAGESGYLVTAPLFEAR